MRFSPTISIQLFLKVLESGLFGLVHGFGVGDEADEPGKAEECHEEADDGLGDNDGVGEDAQWGDVVEAEAGHDHETGIHRAQNALVGAGYGEVEDLAEERVLRRKPEDNFEVVLDEEQNHAAIAMQRVGLAGSFGAIFVEEQDVHLIHDHFEHPQKRITCNNTAHPHRWDIKHQRHRCNGQEHMTQRPSIHKAATAMRALKYFAHHGKQ